MRQLSPFWTARNFSTDLWSELDRMFEAEQERAFGAGRNHSLAVASEITEGEGHYLVSLDLPGLKKEEIHIEASDGVLTISGERKREEKSDKENVHRTFKSYGSFKKSFTLPTTVNAEKIEAQYENGVLEVYLPKSEAAQPKKIEVQTGKEGFFSRLIGSKKESSESKTANH